MRTTRRDFLKTSSLIGLGASVPTFLARTALATQPNGATSSDDTILVVVQLTGGNDGLNTVIPFADENYYKLRPTLGIAKDRVQKINDSLGLHPSMDGLAGLVEDATLAIVQGVGYPNPSQSHFRSMDIWHAASMADTFTEGWLGKALKQVNAPAFHLAAGNESSPLALDGAPARAPSITSLEDFQLKMTAASKSDKQSQKAVIQSASEASSRQPGLLDFVQRTALNTYASSDRLQAIGNNYQPKVPYPNTGLAERLKLAAQIIDAGLGARIFYVSIGNFDTHANQANAHANLLGELSGALTAFYKDLSARGHQDRLMIMTFSEFGRRPYENGSRGTDHGTSAPMFLIGNKVKAGPIGQHPSLTERQFGNLKHHIDFRSVYAGVLDHWLGVDSAKVLGKKFKPVDLFA